MKDAGFGNGFSMGYLCRAENGLPGGQFLKDQLAGLNIDLQLKIVDETEWNRGRVSLDYDSQSGALTVLPIPEGTEGVKVGTVIATLAGEGEDTSAGLWGELGAPQLGPSIEGAHEFLEGEFLARSGREARGRLGGHA